MKDLKQWFDDELTTLEQSGLRRTLRIHNESPDHSGNGGRLDFSSNDYLGLSSHPAILSGAHQALDRWGAGARGSRLMCGTLGIHEQAEKELADWIGYPSGLVFGSGFLTNLGVLGGFCDKRTVIFADRLNHASLIDGARLSGARLIRYRHGDVEHLERRLRRYPADRRWVVSDTVFSMDGDIAPVRDIARLCKEEGAGWIADEAHAVGVFGPDGRGVCFMEGVRPDVLVGTFSKALGSYGGFALMDEKLRDYLLSRSRAFIYSTALAPACIGAAMAAIKLIRGAGGAMGEELLRRAEYFRQCLSGKGFDTSPSRSPIVPVRVGDNHATLAAARRLATRGVGVVAIRPPTVPAGTARLRLSVTLNQSEAVLDRAAAEIDSTFHDRECGL